MPNILVTQDLTWSFRKFNTRPLYNRRRRTFFGRMINLSQNSSVEVDELILFSLDEASTLGRRVDDLSLGGLNRLLERSSRRNGDGG